MKPNVQVIEKRIASNGAEIDIVDVFLTIQGEGPFTGRPAIFIRLAGCNLQCPGCDTDYTSNRESFEYGSIIDKVVDLDNFNDFHNAPTLVVITGGEPFRQNITALCNKLIELTYEVQVETNGSFAPIGALDKNVVIVCSPKTGSVNKEIQELASCYKYVMAADSVDPEDGLPIQALQHAVKSKLARPPKGMPVYLQPMDAQDTKVNEANLKAVLDSCMKFNYRLQIQIHKILGVD